MNRKRQDERLNDLYREHSGSIFGFLYRALRDRERCEELTHDCFIICRKRLVESPPDNERFFLYGIAHNLYREERRRLGRQRRLMVEKRDRLTGEEITQRDQHDELVGAQTAGIVRNEIGRLPDELQVPLILREYQDCNYEEIAGIVGIPVGTVRSRIFRARKILAERLRPLLEPKHEVE
ncbi:MAG: RNA polymerase sigma factor [bacterium]|nr:RNA polymerase sigma factor [bacterium]